MLLSRRNLLIGAGGLASLALAGCSDSGDGASQGGGDQALDVLWWGSDSRAKLTNQIFDLFAKQNPGMTATGQFLAFANYFDKLATLAAAGSVPDIIQTNPGSLTQYADSGQLLDLGTLNLDLGDYQDAAMASGQASGKQYGLAFGYQYVTVFFNDDMVKSSGVSLPDKDGDWTAWADAAVEIQGKLPSKVYAMSDCSSDSNSFESWMTGRGKSLFTPDGKLGYDESDVTDWFHYWTDLRERGAIAPAADSVTHLQTGAVTDEPVAKGTAAMTLGINVGFESLQQVTKGNLDIAACPAGPSGRCETNHFFGWSVSSGTKSPDAVKAFMELWFTSTEAATILGTDRALLASNTQLKALNEVAKGATKRLLTFSLDHPDITPAAPPPTPSSVGNVQSDALRRVAVAIVTGSDTPESGAKKLVDEVQGTLNG